MTKTNQKNIEGLEKLKQILPDNPNLKGAYLKGTLLHDDDRFQLTYVISDERVDKTYTIEFLFESYECNNITPPNKTLIEGIEIDEQNGRISFVDKTNGIKISCSHLCIKSYETLNQKVGEKLAEDLTKKYVNEMSKKIHTIRDLELKKNVKLFKEDPSYNGIEADHHIMYKLPSLKNKDGSIEYEFLIEFDLWDPSIGIYYGCKGLTKRGNHEENIKALDLDWKNLQLKVCKRLNNIFPNKKFDYRFKPTDNANDNTYWPFWISLYEDENIIEVAVRAIIAIRDEYKQYLEGNDYKPDEVCKYSIPPQPKEKGEGEVHSETRFTEESYGIMCRAIKVNKRMDSNEINDIWKEVLEGFIEWAKRKQILEDVVGYEKAYRFRNSPKEFSFWVRVITHSTAFIYNEKYNKKYEAKTPWEKICLIFLNEKNEPLDANTLKNSLKPSTNNDTSRILKNEEKNILYNELQDLYKNELSSYVKDKTDDLLNRVKNKMDEF